MPLRLPFQERDPVHDEPHPAVDHGGHRQIHRQLAPLDPAAEQPRPRLEPGRQNVPQVRPSRLTAFREGTGRDVGVTERR